jgi:hypothetical protein
LGVITLTLEDLLLIFVVFLVALFLIFRLAVFALKRILPKMVPQMMGEVKHNFPKISIKDAIGFGIWKFLDGGGIGIILEQLGLQKPPQQPPQLPPGGP